MDFSRVTLTEEQLSFRDEVRKLLDKIVTPDVLEHEHRTGDGFNEDVHLALGARGLLYPSWPVAEGGAGLDAVCRRILNDEIERRRVPWITHGTTRLVWSAVAQHAEPGLAAALKPEVAAGRVRFCLGYTDPEGGSDIAAAHLRAVRDGEDWVLDGAKMFTTGAHNCQYTFLIARTDADLPKHKGLTMFLVPLDAPGVEIAPIRTFGGERTNAVYYSSVRVSDRYRLGAVNAGWGVLHDPLDAEHLGTGGNAGEAALEPVSMGARYTFELDQAISAAARWARMPRPDGTRPADDPVFLDQFGRIIVECEAGLVTPGLHGRNKGSLALIAGAADLIDLIGPEALLGHGADGAIDDGEIDYAHRFAQGTATYGGTTEVFKNMIAERLLGLPRPAYPGSKSVVR
jgi:alkylation response protein AidB-like acyl-CoA dehydrogenase